MKKFVAIVFILILFFGITNIASARSGCCSHHGGVCDCGCCDGTPLSATCAPYYPECNSESVAPLETVQIQAPTSNPINSIEQSVSEPASTEQQSSESIKAHESLYVENTSESEDYSWLGWLVAVSAIFGIGYFIGKNKKQ